MTKYKLRCFVRGEKFDSKEEVFRNQFDYPICEDCLYEELDHDWDDEYIETIISYLKSKFNRNYNKFQKWFFENHTECDGEHTDYDPFYELNDRIVVIDGKNYCSYCIDEMEWNLTQSDIDDYHKQKKEVKDNE